MNCHVLKMCIINKMALPCTDNQTSLSETLGLPLLCASPAHHSHNKVVQQSLRIWLHFRKHFGLQSFSLQSLVAANHLFAPQRRIISFTFDIRRDKMFCRLVYEWVICKFFHKYLSNTTLQPISFFLFLTG